VDPDFRRVAEAITDFVSTGGGRGGGVKDKFLNLVVDERIILKWI
jgi:hypothetical protein